MRYTIVILLALAGLITSARATALRPGAAPALLTLGFFLFLIVVVDHGIGIL